MANTWRCSLLRLASAEQGWFTASSDDESSDSSSPAAESASSSITRLRLCERVDPAVVEDDASLKSRILNSPFSLMKVMLPWSHDWGKRLQNCLETCQVGEAEPGRLGLVHDEALGWLVGDDANKEVNRRYWDSERAFAQQMLQSSGCDDSELLVRHDEQEGRNDRSGIPLFDSLLSCSHPRRQRAHCFATASTLFHHVSRAQHCPALSPTTTGRSDSNPLLARLQKQDTTDI